MATFKEGSIVKKLNSTNYANWKFKIEMLLIKEELFQTITDTPPEPITTNWSKKGRKARAIINLSIEDNQIVHVKNLEIARDTWNALKRIHERTMLSSKLYLLRKLHSTKLPEGSNRIIHITKM